MEKNKKKINSQRKLTKLSSFEFHRYSFLFLKSIKTRAKDESENVRESCN